MFLNSYRIWILIYISRPCCLEMFISCQRHPFSVCSYSRKMHSNLPISEDVPWTLPVSSSSRCSCLPFKGKHHLWVTWPHHLRLFPRHSNLVFPSSSTTTKTALYIMMLLGPNVMYQPLSHITSWPHLTLLATSFFLIHCLPWGTMVPYCPDFPPT